MTSFLKPAPDITQLTAHELSRAIHARDVSCVEVMRAYLERIAAINPRVNALVSLQDEGDLLDQAADRDAQLVRGESMGWMHGMPQAIKDMANVKGLPTTLGSPLMRNFVAKEDGLMVQRMKSAGCIIVGKTNTPEFGLGSHTFNEVFGLTRNAYDLTRSAGEAVAVLRSPWRPICCRWRMAQISWGACETQPHGTTYLVSGPVRVVCPCGRSAMPTSANWVPKGRWVEPWRMSPNCCRCSQVRTGVLLFQ